HDHGDAQEQRENESTAPAVPEGRDQSAHDGGDRAQERKAFVRVELAQIHEISNTLQWFGGSGYEKRRSVRDGHRSTRVQRFLGVRATERWWRWGRIELPVQNQ